MTALLHPTGMRGEPAPCPTRCLLSLQAVPFAWPGGYERFLILEDGALLCHRCARVERERVGAAGPGEGWLPVSVGSADWLDEPGNCLHCWEVIG